MASKLKKKQTIKNRNDYRTGLRYRRGWPEAVTGFFFFFFLLQRNIQRKRSDKVTQKRVGHRRKKGFFCLVFFFGICRWRPGAINQNGLPTLGGNASSGSAQITRFQIEMLPIFAEFYWVLLGFIGFYWVLLGFTGFYWVLLGFTVFYWVLLGFTGFYWVLLGFIGFS